MPDESNVSAVDGADRQQLYIIIYNNYSCFNIRERGTRLEAINHFRGPNELANIPLDEHRFLLAGTHKK